jgi:hypothetical protein
MWDFLFSDPGPGIWLGQMETLLELKKNIKQRMVAKELFGYSSRILISE